MRFQWGSTVLVSAAVLAWDAAGGAEGESVSDQVSRPAYEDLGGNQKLAPLLGSEATVETWEERRGEIRKRWEELLGSPSFGEGDYGKASEVIETFGGPGFLGKLVRQPTGPGTRQLILIMEPERRTHSPRPGAVVPFYHPDPMAGFDISGKKRLLEKVTTQFGRHLVQQGYVVVCTEAFPYNLIPEPEKEVGLSRWGEAAKKLLEENPEWTGMGKLVHDTRRGIDLLLEQKDIDPERIVAIGHSLGGKMAFYTGCLDDRVKATIASDFGIGWKFTNWEASWYLGDQIASEDFPFAHHELLALHAPRPFLLVAGQYDKPESWQYLNAARPVYSLLGRERAVGMIDHASGHQPTKASVRLAYRWLAEQFSLEPQAWDF